ncbi:MAG: FtsX-like permease family protein [Candidatus Latescibacteria bacterium]|nr:FtsX-like permease family protein [Candidatus Latescibacterota bacterium]
MKLWRIVIREILHNRLTFLVALLSVTVAVGVFTAELTVLDAYDIETERILSEKSARLEEDMRVMEDDYRKIMKELGYNLLILPKGQKLGNFYADGYASKLMPEDFVTRLSETDIMTIQHLLPSLERKIRWPEQANRTIILVGTRGEVPYLRRNPKEPMLDAVKPGEIVLGYELWNSIGLELGDRVTLLGRKFTVGERYLQRGNKDDITAWVDLETAQEMLGCEGEINAIVALKCMCEANEIGLVRKQVADILPETQVIEIDNKVVTRAKARERAKATADSALSAEKLYRENLRGKQEEFASWLVPLVILGSAILIGVLAFNNVRERRAEIGILRAIGYRSNQILTIFIAKALVLGTLGAIIGYSCGFAIAAASINDSTVAINTPDLFNLSVLIAVLLSVPLLSAVSSWIPALIAARQDPAGILSEE